jgi:hypothetical protein
MRCRRSWTREDVACLLRVKRARLDVAGWQRCRGQPVLHAARWSWPGRSTSGRRAVGRSGTSGGRWRQAGDRDSTWAVGSLERVGAVVDPWRSRGRLVVGQQEPAPSVCGTGGAGLHRRPEAGRPLAAPPGFSLQANSKTREGASHPDRNAQFEHINAEVKAFQAAGEPAISVDTKKERACRRLQE